MKTWNELPKEIREKMIEMCSIYGNVDVNEMKKRPDNGFRWTDTPDGHDFWADIILRGKYDRFYERYYPHRSVYGRLEMLEAEVKELRKERDAVSCGCTGVEIKIPEKNIVTQFPSDGDCWFKINGMWAGSLFSEREGEDYNGCFASGHSASLYLNNNYGKWYNQDGEKVSGYFYYKPNDED